MVIKCTMPPTTAAWSKSSKIIQDIKNAKREGAITIMAIIVPLMIISCIVSLLEISVNKFDWKFVNKNQIL